MAHASGNPAWTNTVSTPVTATTLEAQEGATDALYNSYLAGTSRTQPYRCIVVYGASYGQPNSDTFATSNGNWGLGAAPSGAFYDPDGMFYNGSTGPGYTGYARIQIPITGFWDLEFHCLGQTTATAQYVNCYLSIGTGTTAPTVANNAVGMDSKYFAASANMGLTARFFGQVTGGSFLYWSTWGSVASGFTMQGTLFQARTQVIARWCGT
jgi:hypothetical protein